MGKIKDYMARDKFFYVNPSLYNAREWPFKTRYAIGVRLADFRARNEKVFRFLIKGKMYSIPRDMAFHFGLKYMIPSGVLPNLLPLDVFNVVEVKSDSKAVQSRTPWQLPLMATN